jgi:hypothetical protein
MVVDIRWGYNTVQIVEEDQHKAAFVTNRGLFQPKVMFFGLTNSPATFQTMMDTIFCKQIARGTLTVYMDDICEGLWTASWMNESLLKVQEL